MSSFRNPPTPFSCQIREIRVSAFLQLSKDDKVTFTPTSHRDWPATRRQEGALKLLCLWLFQGISVTPICGFPCATLSVFPKGKMSANVHNYWCTLLFNYISCLSLKVGLLLHFSVLTSRTNFADVISGVVEQHCTAYVSCNQDRI